jgi:hypothetical protein
VIGDIAAGVFVASVVLVVFTAAVFENGVWIIFAVLVLASAIIWFAVDARTGERR